jgi:hypothetical protein
MAGGIKTVYVNDVPIGLASTWSEAKSLITKSGISFVGKPSTAEGLTGFFIYGTQRHAEERKGGAGRG